MRCKREIMGLAALMVVLYHFYIPFGQSPVEIYFFRSTFVGVDLFFFVSACSLVGRNRDHKFEFGKFILNRIELIYIPFVILAAICSLYKKWTFIQFLKVISGIEFFERGGGSFLWYFIGIMIIYLLVPLFLFIRNKLRLWGLPVLILFWFAVSCLVQFVFKRNQLFILINRLPVFFLGMYYEELIRKYVLNLKKYYVVIIELILMAAGVFLTYRYATVFRLNKPFQDIYYVLGIPMIIAVVLIIDSLTTWLQNIYTSRVLRFMGGITLELYGLQMIFGYDMENAMLKKIMTMEKPIMQLAFIGTVIVLIVMAFIFNRLLTLPRKLRQAKINVVDKT